MKVRTIDLRNKTIAQARKILKRLIKFRMEKGVNLKFNFLLPAIGERKKSNSNLYEAIKGKCPYCQSPLTETESGIVCTSKNIRSIIFDIEETKKRFGAKAELFASTKANRFWDYYQEMGRDMTCDYIQGNEERKFKIRSRLLRAGVDRKKIFGGG